MPKISNEREFREALASLSSQEGRTVSALFLQNVLDVTKDPRIRRIISVALDRNANEKECEDAYNTARSIATETFTHLGEELDPDRQALHFLATAAAYCLLPDRLRPYYCRKRAPWAIAMHTRMARCWSQMAQGKEEEEMREGEDQYKTLAGFLAAR
jgi:hypothetical protein